MPFHKCLVQFRKQWNIRSYLVNALATFFVLSYVKILNVSLQFLTSSLVYDVNGQLVSKRFWYYDGRVVMTSREYLPYLVLALSMLLTFNVFPLVLLTLYPFKFFQVFLNNCPCLKYKLALRLFMDAFYGCYKDNYRHFAALYLAVGLFTLLLFSVFSRYTVCMSIASLSFVIALTLVAKFQPYKQKRSNSIDICMLLTLITAAVITTLQSAIGLSCLKLVRAIILAVVALIPLSYILFLALAHIGSRTMQYFSRIKIFLLERISQISRENRSAAHLNQRIADYSTFPKSPN